MRGLRALIGGVADRRRGAMTVAVTRRELGAGELRREAGRCRDARAARRMLAPALVLEGASREEAARAAGMDRQTLRDWVHRYNEEGLDGLSDRRRPGPRPRLTPEQEAELATVVERGPDPERDGVGRWRRTDLKALIEARFAVRPHERTVGKVLCRLAFPRLSVRPKHPEADEAAQAAFKKASPRWSRRRCPSMPAASRSRSGSRCYEDGLRGDWPGSAPSHRSPRWPFRQPPMMDPSSSSPSSSATRPGCPRPTCPGPTSRSCTGSGPATRRRCSPPSPRCGRASRASPARRSTWPAALRRAVTDFGA